MKFRVERKILERYNPISIGILVCRGINNNYIGNEISQEFTYEKENVKSKFSNVELSSYPVIQKWRQIYKSFGEKKNRCSVEALIRRTVNGKEIPEINPLVDIYNTASLKFEVPVGGEDLSCVDQDIVLGYADGTETFIPLGTSEIEHPDNGDIVYKSGNKVLCGKFNYKESDITKLTENTKDAVLVIEHVEYEDTDKLNQALDYMAEKIEKFLGAKCTKFILNKEKNEVEIGEI